MQARGAVIADRPLNTNWSFGTITVGSIGTLASSIQNTGNAAAAVSLQGLMNPTIFGLQNNPTTVVANGASAFVAQFVPPSADGQWSDQGTLAVTTSQAFCQPLPAAWNGPTISLSGSSTSMPPVSASGSLAFPSADCGSPAPAAQTVTLTNNTNQAYVYSQRLGSGAFYTITSAGAGTIAAGGTAAIAVAPNTVTPGQGVQTGSAPYADSLIVNTSPASGDGGSGATAPSFTIPISWTLNGAVLVLPQGAGPRKDSGGNAFYPADTNTGFALPINNTGTESATVSFNLQPSNVITFSPASQSVAAGANTTPQIASSASDAACPATTSATVTFNYSGPICQPLQASQVTVHACSGTFQ
jgi:hypothetical protein